MNLLLRVASGAVLIIAVGICLWLGGPVIGGLLAVAVIAGCREYAGLCSRLGAAPLPWLLYPTALWWALRFYLPSGFPAVEIGLGAGLVLGLLGVVALRAPLVRFMSSLIGAVCIGLCLGYFGAIQSLPGHLDHFGLRLVVLALIGPVTGDTVAYFAGTAFGRHRFFPSISPKKSVEGAVAGGGAVVAVLALLAPTLTGMPAWQGALLGLLVTVAAQGGDLAESQFKREAGVKDSSQMIPGHGGVLDRLDSLLLVGPVVFCFVKLVALT